jgi:hypothetical protein
MARLPECGSCGARIHGDICHDCAQIRAEYLAEMDDNYWEGSDD